MKKCIHSIMRATIILGMLISTPLLMYADIRPAAIFSDGMVLQQNDLVQLWGWGKPGEKVKVELGWTSKIENTETGSDGRWSLQVKTIKAGGPYTITFTGSNVVRINDILLGEVWLCSGQSNMVFSLKGSEHAKEEIASANFPMIRYFSVKRQYGLNRFNDCEGSIWVKTSPANAGSFSAVAYYFAKKIQAELHVPVGIVYAAWGGTPAEAWTPRSTIEKDTVLHRYIDRWTYIQDHAGVDSVQYHRDINDWRKGDTLKQKKPGEPQTVYYFHRPWREPALLYNGMIDPVVPFAMKGVLWYQGESNVAYASEYARLMRMMIAGWRSNWKELGYRDALAFYLVQLAAYDYNDHDAAARLRQAQAEVAQTVSNSGLAVTIDLGNMNDIHYTRKKEAGERLAAVALVKTYKKKINGYEGPLLTNTIVAGREVTLNFSGSGLMSAGGQSGAFELGYRNSPADTIQFIQASAIIDQTRITLRTSRTDAAVAVRYAWMFPGEANVFNKEGYPLAPFTKLLH